MTPLLSATLGYAAGLLAGLRWAPPALLALVLACVFTFLPRNSRSRRSTALIFLAAGTAIGSTRAHSTRTDCRARLAEGDTVTLRGHPLTLVTAGAPLVFHADVLAADGIRCADVRLRLRVPPRYEALMDSAALGTGAALILRGRWMAYAPRNRWPRRPEYAGALLVTEAAPDQTGRATAVTRFRAGRQAQFRALLPERWPLAESLILAQRAGLTPHVREQWVAAGMVHLLAISGMHVGLIAAGVLILARAARQPPRRARRLALLVTAAYVLFLGAPSAALRALLQAGLLLVSVELQRPAHAWTLLAAAAFVILALDPLAVLDPGFQLSFAGMIGLIGWRRPLVEWLPARLPAIVRDGLAAGIAASALTTPLAALHFGTASWIGIPASVIAAPLLALAVAAIVLALSFHALTGLASGFHAWAADSSLLMLERVAAAAAAVPGGHGLVSPVAVYASLLGIAFAIVVNRHLSRHEPRHAPGSQDPDRAHTRWATRSRRRRLRLAAGGAAMWVVFAWAPLVAVPGDGRLEIHAIDVGQGDALAIRTPGNRWILVDAGPRTLTRDAGRDRVVPYLVRQGVRRLHALVLTHPDADHIGGAPAVLDAFPVEIVIDPGLPAGKDMFIDLLHTARQTGQRWVAGREGIRLDVDGVSLELMYPLHALDASVDANDHSVVFRLAYGEFAALFTGDAPDEVEDRLIEKWGDGLRITLLKVGHHGSTTSTGERLLTVARPELAVVSSGRNNRYGHPAPSVLARLAAHGVQVLRTDQLGNITVRAWRSGRTEVVAD